MPRHIPPLLQARALMRVSELAGALGMTSGRVYQLIAEGVIPAIRLGRAVRVPSEAYDAWMRRCTADAIKRAREAARGKVAEPATGKDSRSAHARATADSGYTGVLTVDSEIYERIMAARTSEDSRKEQDA